jgi:hypothetical protein
MKTVAAIAIAMFSVNAYAIDPVAASQVYDKGSETVLHQNEQNDPSIFGRRTVGAYHLNTTANEDSVTVNEAVTDKYPTEIGQSLEDEGYPAK